MEQPPFPTALVVMVAFFGLIAVTTDALWIRVGAIIAVLFVGTVAVVKSLPQRIVEDEPEPDDELG
jgi:hypothetical protein